MMSAFVSFQLHASFSKATFAVLQLHIWRVVYTLFTQLIAKQHTQFQ